MQQTQINVYKKKAAIRLISKFRRVVRSADKAFLRKRATEYHAYLKEKYPNGRPRYKRAEYFRMMVHSWESAAYLSRHIKIAQRMFAEYRECRELSERAPVEVEELCKMFPDKLEEEKLKAFLRRIDEEEERIREAKKQARLAKKGLKANEMTDMEIYLFEKSAEVEKKKFYDTKRLKKAKEKLREKYDGYGGSPKKKKKNKSVVTTNDDDEDID